MRHALLLVPILAGCRDNRIFSECCFDSGRDSGFELPDEPATGDASVDLSYSFSTAANCADAGLVAFTVTATMEDAEPVEFTWPCDDGVVHMSNLDSSYWTFEITDGTDEGWHGRSEVLVDGPTTTAITLSCLWDAC